MRFRSRPYDTQEVRDFVAHCEISRRYHWGIFSGGTHIGNVSTSSWSQENHWIDLSFLVGDSNYWGKGIATTAVAAAVNYFFDRTSYRRIIGGASSGNIGSIKVMENVGMKLEGRLREQAYYPALERYMDDMRFGILKDEWRTKKSDFPDLSLVHVEKMNWE